MGVTESNRWREKQLRRILGHSQTDSIGRGRVLSGCRTPSIFVLLLRDLSVWLAFSSNLTLFMSLFLLFQGLDDSIPCLWFCAPAFYAFLCDGLLISYGALAGCIKRKMCVCAACYALLWF